MTTQYATVERDDHYNFAYLDESTKRMLRRALLKAVAIPGYQVPFGSREMPLPYGWGTGGIQVTASIIGANDVLKVIDQVRTTPPTRSTSAASSAGSRAWRRRNPLLPPPSCRPAIASPRRRWQRADHGVPGAHP